MKMNMVVGGLVGALLLAGATCSMADTISIRADEWCPYNCEEGAADPGYMIEVANAIFGKAGHTVEYKTMPWARAIEDTRKGTFTAIVGAAVGDAEDFIFPQTVFGQSANGFCVRKGDSFKYGGVESFKGKVLGVIRDYAYDEDVIDEYIEKNKDNPKLVQVASGDDALDINLKKLTKGRVDVIIDDYSVLRRTIKEMGAADQYSCSEGIEPTDIFIAFSPANPKAKEFAATFDKGLAELRASGEFARILAVYGLEDWK